VLFSDGRWCFKGYLSFSLYTSLAYFSKHIHCILFVGSKWSFWGCCWFDSDKLSFLNSHKWAYVLFHSTCIFAVGTPLWIFYHPQECGLDQVLTQKFLVPPKYLHSLVSVNEMIVFTLLCSWILITSDIITNLRIVNDFPYTSLQISPFQIWASSLDWSKRKKRMDSSNHCACTSI